MDATPASPTPDVLLAEARFVRALARELLADEHQAEDLVQETWLRFLARPPRSAAAARSWLRSVTARLSIENLRTRARRSAREERAARPEALPSVEDELARTEVLRSVAAEVLALDEPYRTAVLLAYWRGWDAHRIARETATPLATVRSRLQRAHQRLRERLDKSHGREAWALALSSLPEASGGGAALLAGAVAVVVGAAAIFLWSKEERVAEVARASAGADEAGVASIVDAPLPPDDPLEGERSELARAATVHRIVGTVSDLACDELALPARPAAGLELSVKLVERPWSEKALAELVTRTDERGRFAVEIPDPGQSPLHVRVSAAADERYRMLLYTAELTGPLPELALSRAPHGVLHGAVQDERGEPVAGLELDLEGVLVTSDAAGRFASSEPRRFRRLSVHDPACALLGWEGGLPLDVGGYTPLRVLVGPAGRLLVRVVDREGKGLAGVSVTATLPECELARIGRMLSTDAGSVAGKTDELGLALLERVWSGCKLRVRLGAGRESFACEAMAGGRLLLVANASGQPIVIARGAELELEARIDVERDVAGEVRLPDGSPAPRAHVEIADLGRGDAWSRPVLLALTTDERGRFAGHLRTAELVGPLRVVATAPELAEKSKDLVRGLGYGGPSPVKDVDSLEMPAARRDADPLDAETLAHLVLTLGPRHAIRGTLLGRDGAPMTRFGMGGSRIWAVPAGSAHHKHGVEGHARKDRPGAFEIPGLEPGRYDVCVSEELEDFYTFENFLHRFPDVEAGAGEIELRLPERREVHVRVRIAGGEPSSTIVLHRKLFPERTLEAPHARDVERVSGARPWPAGSAFAFSGISGARTGLGPTSDGLDSFEGPEHALHPLEPGWYAIGVQPYDAEGAAAFFPQCTPILWFDEGEHVVEFELLPVATLHGRVVGDAAGEFLALALVDERGTIVPLAPLEGFTHATAIVDTSANGEFVLHLAPTGAFRLRAGSRAELARGEFRVELPLVIQPGENPRVELRL